MNLAFFSMMNQFREDYAAAVRENQMRKEEEEKKSRREMAKVAAEQVNKLLIFHLFLYFHL